MKMGSDNAFEFKQPNPTEVIEHHGERPIDIAPDEWVQFWKPHSEEWSNPQPASVHLWRGYQLRFAYHALSDTQIEAACKARGWKVEKPSVMQEKRDRVADAYKASGKSLLSGAVYAGHEDELVLAMHEAFDRDNSQ
jgi:hypothetical protein